MFSFKFYLIFLKSIENLGKVKSQETYITNSFLNSIFESCCTPQLEKFWIEFIENNKQVNHEQTLIRFIEVFFTNKTEFLPTQINLILRVMSFSEFSVECLKRLLLSLKKNSFFVRDLCKNDHAFNIFCSKTFAIFKRNPSDKLKPSMIYSFVKKFEDWDYENIELYSILYKVFLQSLKEGSDKFLHKSIVEFFLEKPYNQKSLHKELLSVVKSNNFSYFHSFHMLNKAIHLFTPWTPKSLF